MDNVPQKNHISSSAGSKQSELIKRIVSGVVMAGAALVMTVFSPQTFFVLVALAACVMCWECRNIILSDNEASKSHWLFALHLVSVLGALFLVQLGYHAYAVGFLASGAFALLLLSPVSIRWFSFFGPIYTGVPAMGLVWLRSDVVYGLTAVLFIFMAVWMADIAAYGAGRTLAGPKLSPRISPNKTWSGAIGGLLGSALVGLLFAYYIGTTSTIALVLVAFFLGVASQIGDLFESFMKRKFGIKDSSNLIPGHGGILDRVDGLIFAAILAAVMAFLINPASPGHAILIW